MSHDLTQALLLYMEHRSLSSITRVKDSNSPEMSVFVTINRVSSVSLLYTTNTPQILPCFYNVV